jgi:endonuclease YncB( thermonuclease family)
MAVFIWAAIAAFAAGFFEYSEGRLGWLTSYFSVQPEMPDSGDKLWASFSLCSGPIRVNCIVDGDTFWFRGTKIRIADIDTPELSPSRCAREAELGEAAKHRLLALLNAGHFSLASADHDTDRYGRKLRTVSRDGRSLGDVLVAEGLARRWQGSRRSWCR